MNATVSKIADWGDHSIVTLKWAASDNLTIDDFDFRRLGDRPGGGWSPNGDDVSGWVAVLNPVRVSVGDTVPNGQ